MKTFLLASAVLISALQVTACSNSDRSATKGTDPTPDAQNARDQPKFSEKVPGQSPQGADADAQKKDRDRQQP